MTQMTQKKRPSTSQAAESATQARLPIYHRVGSLLSRRPAIYKLAHWFVHRTRGFKTATPGGPASVQRALAHAADQFGGGVRGCYYEFGVFKGFTLFSAERKSRELGMDGLRLYGFDSFSGLPELDPKDEGGRVKIYFPGQFACSKERVEGYLRKEGVAPGKVTLIQGFFEDVLTTELAEQHDFGPALVVMVDCDLYSSAATVLEWVEEYLIDGSIILFDDYLTYRAEVPRETLGEELAFAEFLTKHPSWNAEALWDYPMFGRVFRLSDTSGRRTLAGKVTE